MSINAPDKKVIKKSRGELTPEHKRALANGREQGAIVRRYLEALESVKPQRGGKRKTSESIEKALLNIDEKLPKANALVRLQLNQVRRELLAELKRKDSGTNSDISELEADFIKVAISYSKRKGISYGAWRDAGVSGEILKKAGITRTRG